MEVESIHDVSEMKIGNERFGKKHPLLAEK